MVQVGIPDANLSNDWTVVGALSSRPHQALDEGVDTPDDDTTYVEGGNLCRVSVSNSLIDPGVTNDHVIRLRFKKGSGVFQPGAFFEVHLVRNTGAKIASFKILDINNVTAYENRTLRIRPVDAAAIGNYDQLGVEMSTSGGNARVTAIQVEIPNPPDPRMTRQAVEVMALASAAHQPVRVTRQGVEVMASLASDGIRVTRQGVEALALASAAHRPVRVSRQGVEVMAKQTVSQVTALSLPAVLPPLFPANWISQVEIETAWSTDVRQSPTSVAEERTILLARPSREVRVLFTAPRRRLMSRLITRLLRMGQQRGPFPIYSDVSLVTSASSGTELLCDTANRRFFIGGRVVVFEWDVPNGELVNVQYGLIGQVQADRLVLQDAVSPSVPVDARVVPCVDAEIELDHSADLHTDEVIQATVVAREVVGKSALPALSSADSPSGYPTHASPVDGELPPILDVRPNWAQSLGTQYLRPGERYASGRSEIVQVDGARPIVVHDLRFTMLTREDVWKVLRLFDSRRGRGRPWWVVSPVSFFNPQDIQTGYVDVDRDVPIEDLQTFFEHVGIVEKDGTVTVRGISSVADTGGAFRVSFDSALSSAPALADVERVTTAHLCRFDSDSIVESWPTNVVAEIDATARDVLAEAASALTNPTDTPDPPESLDDIANLEFWFASSSHVYAGLPDQSPPTNFQLPQRTIVAEPDQDLVITWDDVRETPSSRFLQCAGSTQAHAPLYIQFASGSLNGSKPTVCMKSTVVAFKLHEGAGEAPKAIGEFWSNSDGLTLVFNCRIGDLLPSPLFSADFVIRPGVLEWERENASTTVCRMMQTKGTNDPNANITFTQNPQDGQLHTWVLTWDPGSYARIYRDGVLLGSATTPVASLPTDDEATEFFEWQAGTYIEDNSPDQNVADGRAAYLNELIAYRRALSVSELNQVGEYLKNLYGSPWTTIV